MASARTVLETDPIPKWKVGPRIWRTDGEWRLRIYRPWTKKAFVEVQTQNLMFAIYILGIGAGWWKAVDK